MTSAKFYSNIGPSVAGDLKLSTLGWDEGSSVDCGFTYTPSCLLRYTTGLELLTHPYPQLIVLEY